MLSYILRRLLLLPLTLFCIVLINFFIINLAPGEPTTITEISGEGDVIRDENQALASIADDQYLQFREHYGLTLPIFFNTWPSISKKEVENTLYTLIARKKHPKSKQKISIKKYNELRVRFGDQSRYLSLALLRIAKSEEYAFPIRRLATHFFVRGATRQGYVGPQLSKEQKQSNYKIAKDNLLLQKSMLQFSDSEKSRKEKIQNLQKWYEENKKAYYLSPNFTEKIKIFFFETRFFRYISRVAFLDFGSIRNDPNKKVTYEVCKRFKYSLTLAILPMAISFVFCQIFGLFMAVKQNKWQDFILNIVFLVLYATPVFVVAPFLIEKIALHNTFPFTDIPIPLSHFSSKESVYREFTSWQRVWDIAQHIVLPLTAIMYGSLAAQTRLSRTAVLEVLKQDYVRTAHAKGLPPSFILFKHVGRNAAITVTTSIAGSLGIILGGSLIVETIFEINGFGRFFYEAVINRDYNVIMFSSLVGASLSLLGYLLADITYTLLDPRITLD